MTHAVAAFAFVAALASQTPPSSTPPVDPAADAADDAAHGAANEAANDAAANTDATPPPPPDAMPPGDATSPAPALVDEPNSEAMYRSCVELFQAGEHDKAYRCWLQVALTARGTVAAAKAEAAIMVYRARLQVPETTAAQAQARVAAEANAVPAGRYGTATAAGLFGAANAIGAGVMFGVTVPQSNGTGLVAATALGAVVLGVAGGVGGYTLADKLDLDEGAARLVASSLVWGSLVGVGLAPSVGTLLQQPPDPATGVSSAALPVDAAVITVLASGWAAGGAAVAVAMNVKIDEAQVGWMNSGAFAGSVIGLLVVANIAQASSSSQIPLPIEFSSGAYVLSLGAGIGAGVLIGQNLDTTWGEVLICDLGGVLGLVAGGALAVVIGAPNGSILPPTLATGAGLIAGYGAGIAVVETFRSSRKAPLMRDGPEVRPTIVSALDRTGRAVVGLGVGGSF